MIPRPPVQEHQHGTTTGYTYGCRCQPCQNANAHRSRLARRRRALGQATPNDRVDPRPARAAVLRMRQAGYNDPQISRLAGLPDATIGRVRKSIGRYMTRETSERILHAERLCTRIPARDRLDELYVPSIAAQRRIRALMTRGYRIHDLERELGGFRGGLSSLLYTDRAITPQRDQRIADLYDRLWRSEGPSKTAARRALAKGWATPLELDDDRIGDPTYRPTLHRLTPRKNARQRRQEIVTTVAELSNLGMGAREIAVHAGITPRSVVRIRQKLRQAS